MLVFVIVGRSDRRRVEKAFLALYNAPYLNTSIRIVYCSVVCKCLFNFKKKSITNRYRVIEISNFIFVFFIV